MSTNDLPCPVWDEAEAAFPPEFPFLVLGRGILSEDPVALTPSTRSVGDKFGPVMLFLMLLREVAERIEGDGHEACHRAVRSHLGGILRPRDYAILALTPDFCLLASGQKNRGCDGPIVPSVTLDAIENVRNLMLTARLFDDPPCTRRSWRFSKLVAELSPNESAAPNASWYQVRKTPSSFWSRAQGGLLGPFKDLREALSKAGFYKVGTAVREVRCDADITDHPAIRDALARLAAPPAPGVWFNGTALRLNPQGLLMERLPFEDPLPRPQRLAA